MFHPDIIPLPDGGGGTVEGSGTAAELEALLRDYGGGATIRLLAEKYVHRMTVMAHLDRSGLERRPLGPKLTGRRLARAIELYESGLSLQAIGNEFGVDAGTVRRALSDADIAICKRRGWQPCSGLPDELLVPVPAATVVCGRVPPPIVTTTCRSRPCGATSRFVIVDSVLTGCDLSRARIGTVRSSHLVDCKLAGTDLSEGTLRDTRFERCSLSYTNLRMSRLERVAFDSCRLEETDLHGAGLEDAALDGSELRSVIIDAARFQRVDLRGAAMLDLVGVGDLRGCLLTDAQTHQLAIHLALAAGASVEREK